MPNARRTKTTLAPKQTGWMNFGSQPWRAFVALGFIVVVATHVNNRHSDAAPPPSIASERGEATPAAIDALLSENRLSEANEWLRSVDEQTSSVDWTRTMATLASRYQQQNDIASTAEFYARAVLASENPIASAIPTDKKCLLRLAAATAMLKTHRADAALGTLTWNLDNDDNPNRVSVAAKMLLQVGSQSLASNQPNTASQAYASALPKLSGDEAAAAELGLAWAIALRRDQPELAAEGLEAFSTKYPQHPDAPRALRACASCLQQAERHSEADTKLAELLATWPASQSAIDVVTSHLDGQTDGQTDVEHPATPSFVVDWIVAQIQSEDHSRLTDRMYSFALSSEAAANDPQFWQTAAAKLASSDTTGQVTADTLERMSHSEQSSDAEHLAMMLISPAETVSVAATAREAACRWAGRTQRWSMLALAAEQETPDQQSDSRTIGVERLFAEGLMQVGRPADARVWWEHVVDDLEASDFPTLLRCAETAVAHAPIDEAATRLDQVKAVSGDDRFRQVLLQMLSAELSIRQLNFDQARSQLESVVRSPGEVGTLRPRAQWLIGETFYMQQRFAEAVEAYRTVEGLDPDSNWVAASLVQAGKSFEQLGRTREAAVCYSTLLSRHADSPLAQDARRRLAALSPSGESTIRR